jgi:hypothetical protein
MSLAGEVYLKPPLNPLLALAMNPEIDREIETEWASLDHIERLNQFAKLSEEEQQQWQDRAKRQRSLQTLISDLRPRTKTVRRGRRELFICPFGGGESVVHIEPDLAEDQVSCECGDGTHTEADVEEALRMQVRMLPRKCTEATSEFGHYQNCQTCKIWSAADNRFAQAFVERFFSNPEAAESEEGQESGQGQDPVPECTRHHPRNYDRSQCLTCVNRRAYLRELSDEQVKQRRAEAADPDGESWAPSSLTDVSVPPPPSIMHVGGDLLGYDLIRPGYRVLIHGQPGCGKTPLCYLCVVQEVKRGNLAMIIDYEMGRPQSLAMLREMGLSNDQISRYVIYIDDPLELTVFGKRRTIAEVSAREKITGRKLTAIIIDSFGHAIPPEVSDNWAFVIIAWFRSVVNWMRDQFTSSAVIVIDHTGRTDSEEPIGSVKKRGQVDLNIWLETGKAFDRNSPDGYSTLKVMRDRSGQVKKKTEVGKLKTTPGESFRLELPDPPDPDAMNAKMPEGSSEEEVLADADAAGKTGIMRSKLTRAGDIGQIRRVHLDKLISEGKIVEHKKPGTSTGKICWSARNAPQEAPKTWPPV